MSDTCYFLVEGGDALTTFAMQLSVVFGEFRQTEECASSGTDHKFQSGEFIVLYNPKNLVTSVRLHYTGRFFLFF